MASAAAAMTLSLGSDGPPTCYADIELADAFFFIGSNAADCHPITFERVKKRDRQAASRVHRRRPAPHRDRRGGHVHLPIRPGTDLALLNGLLHLLRDWASWIAAYIADHTEGWAELDAMLADYPPERVADDLRHRRGRPRSPPPASSPSAERLITFWTMGVNQTLPGHVHAATRSSTCTWRPARSASPAAGRSA